MKKKEEIDYKQINEVVKLSKKILDLFYIVMIVGIVFIATLLVKEWGILTFVLSILKVITPLFIGFIIAWLLDPFVRKICAKGVSRVLAAVIVFLIFVACILIFFSVLVPTVYNQLNDLIKAIPGIANSLEGFIDGFFDRLAAIDALDVVTMKENVFANIGNIFSDIATNLPTMILNILKSLFSGIGVIAIGFIVALYMMIDFDETTNHLVKLLPKKNRFEIKSLLENIGVEIRKTVNGTFLVAFMVFIGDSLGFAAIGLKAPILFGLFCGITDLIPYIGPYIGGAAAVIVGFSQSTIVGILVILIVFVVQMIENMVLQPMVMSKTMKLHPVTIIIGLLIFGYFFGIIGMILATPCMALIKVLYRFFALKFNWFEE